MPPMTPEERDAFLAQPWIASFVSLGPAGAPHVTPVWYAWHEGRCIVWTDAVTAKAHHVARDPRVALCIATHEEPYRYVVVEGEAAVTTEGLAAWAEAISVRYCGEAEGRAFAAQSLGEAAGVLLVITPTRILTEAAA